MNALQRLDQQFEATFSACFPSAKSDVGARAIVEGNSSFAALLTFAVLRALLARAFWLNRRNMPIALPEAQPVLVPIDTHWNAVPVITPGGPYVCAHTTGSLFNRFTGERVSSPPSPIVVNPVAQPLKTSRSRWSWYRGKEVAKPTPAPNPSPASPVSHRW